MKLDMGTHDYIGRMKGCGCVVAISADIPEMEKETAKEVAAMIRAGLEVERLPRKEAVALFCANGCPHGKQPKLF